MGLITHRHALTVLLVSVSPVTLLAAPKLRLTATTVGPISIASTTNGSLQTVEAFNAGDGTLAPQASSSVSWLTTSTGPLGACSTRAGQCIPVRIDPRTASLAKGIYTGVVTVADRNAMDAPQTITVTVQVGGGVPDRVERYVAPGRTVDVPFATNSQLTSTVSTQTGGSWLSVAAVGTGTFRTVWNYSYRMNAGSLPVGTYNGSALFSNSRLPEENKTTQVVMQVTNSPILRLGQERVQIRAAQNGVAVPQFISWANAGAGTISFTPFGVTTSTGGDWLKAEPLAGSSFLQITATPGALPVGAYSGEVRVTSNAANSTVAVPVQFDIVAQGPPQAAYGRLWNVGSYDPQDPLAPGTWVELYGEQFTFQAPATAAAPFPVSLAGVRVLVNNVPAPLWYVNHGQINFQVPYEAAAGDAAIVVERSGQPGNRLGVKIASSVPRIRQIGIGNYGIIVNAADGSFPMPPVPGVNARPARRGEALVFYLVGFGQTVPAVTSGAPAPVDPLAWVPEPVQVVFGTAGFGGIPATALYAGLTPGYSGLYQVNVIIPPNAPVGDDVPVTIQSSVSTNQIRVAIQ